MMRLSRLLPTAALVGLVALVATPVAIALRMMADQPGTTGSAQGPASSKRRQALAGFDGERAYEYLVEQCKIGPRISGTDGNRQLRRRMAQHFEAVGAVVELQTFEVQHPLTGAAVEMENVVARWHTDRKTRVVLGAHFDTRPRADKETSPRKKAEPFLGANDGASGVAVLMELGNMMNEIRTTVGVDLVMFDGEELVYDEQGEYFLGSTHFAQEYRKQSGAYRYVAGIVVDMVGDKSLRILPDRVSLRESPQLVQEVWGVARRLGARAFQLSAQGPELRDDHLPLLEVGIPAIDVIDFDYPHWHKVSDTPDKCSAASLAQVGGVLAEWLRGRD